MRCFFYVNKRKLQLILAVNNSENASFNKDKNEVDQPYDVPSEEETEETSYDFTFRKSCDDTHDWSKE